jgi:Xaa-Pro aminopeptidase
MISRLEKVQKRLGSWNVETVIIENPVDLFYLTGLDLSKGRLVLRTSEAHLFVDGRYISYAKEHSPCPVSLLSTAPPLQGPVGFDSAWTTVAALEKLQGDIQMLVPISRPLREERAVKEKSEIKKLREAALLTWEGIKHIQRLLREGISEKELALEFEFFVKKQGASGLSFEPIIAFGENSALPHHRASKDRLRKDQVVLIDVGAVVDHYAADVTRVLFFGQKDPELERLHDLVIEADRRARAQVRVGEKMGSLDESARRVFARAGVEELFVHSLGHGIGLETHEYPLIRFDGEDRDDKIRLGMVFTIEPGLYQPGLGGIRYENTGVVTEQGFESFYPDGLPHA